jgi:hypothetical protein
MTQYNAVKEHILDLLGWGVTPDYLVGHGISRRAIYYVFTELRLKLPDNFDTTGIIPFTPVPISEKPISEKSIPTEPASMRRAALEHPLPPKPKRRQAALSFTAPVALQPNTNTSTEVKNPPMGPSLHIIEAQRRQELLARKAVLASLKKKKAKKIEEAAVQEAPETPSAPSPSVDVDEFLKSIEAIPPSLPPTPVSPTRSRLSVVGEGGVVLTPPSHARKDSSTSVDMDVDDDPGAIPGFGVHKRPSSDSQAMSASNPETPISSGPESGALRGGEHQAASVSRSPSEAVTPVPMGETDAMPTPSSATTEFDRSKPSTPDPASISLNSWATANALRPPSIQRASRKRPRPVAADFVDDSVDIGGMRSEAYIPAPPPPYVRRKLNPFANLSRPRKCVIEVSDTEEDDSDNGDGDGEERTRARDRGGGSDGSGSGGSGSGSVVNDTRLSATTGINSATFPLTQLSNLPLQAPRPVRASVLTQTVTISSLASTPTGTSSGSPSIAGSAQPPPVAPAALLEKEEQIRRMKEMIAQRERERLRKLAAAVSGIGCCSDVYRLLIANDCDLAEIVDSDCHPPSEAVDACSSVCGCVAARCGRGVWFVSEDVPGPSAYYE